MATDLRPALSTTSRLLWQFESSTDKNASKSSLATSEGNRVSDRVVAKGGQRRSSCRRKILRVPAVAQEMTHLTGEHSLGGSTEGGKIFGALPQSWGGSGLAVALLAVLQHPLPIRQAGRSGRTERNHSTGPGPAQPSVVTSRLEVGESASLRTLSGCSNPSKVAIQPSSTWAAYASLPGRFCGA